MNSTSNLSGKLWSRSRLQVIFEFSSFIFINIVSLLGNILVCWVFFRNHRLRTVTNIYIIALALSDIIFTTLCLPIVEGVLLSGRWLYPEWICKAHGFLVLLLCFVSLHTIALTGLNRYFRVAKPNIFKKIFTKKFTICSVLVVLVVAAFLLTFPICIGWASLLFHPGKMACSLQFHDRYIDVAYSGFLAVLIVLTPFIIITISYQKVFKAVQDHKRTLTSTAIIHDHSSKAKTERLSAEEINITKTLFGIVLGFSVCWVPVFVIEFVDSFSGPNNVLPRAVYLVYTFLVSVSCAVNPVLYGVLNKTFRNEYIKILRSCRRRSVINHDISLIRGIRLNNRKIDHPIQTLPDKSCHVEDESANNLAPAYKITLERLESDILNIPGRVK